MCERAIPAPDPAQPPAQAGSSSECLDGDAGPLADLEHHWGSAYVLAVADGRCTARRRDGKGGTLSDPCPDGLRQLIAADYAAMRVPRDLP